MQLVLINNRIVAHGEGFLAMGGVVINTETGKKYEHATIAECSGCPSDIDIVGYEYHAGRFVPCAPYGKGDGNILVACQNDCGAPKDSGIPIKNSVAMPLYLTFVGNVNANMVAAAFGKNNEDEVTGIGKALTMYSNYNKEGITFSALQNYDSLRSIGLSQEAIDEALGSVAITTLMQSNAYSRLYVDLWRLNKELPDIYRRGTFAEVIQDVDVMSYIYDNYTTYEALGIFSSTAFIDFATPYAIDTGTGKQPPAGASYKNLYYDKKCLVLKVKISTTGGYGTADGSFGYRPDGSSTLYTTNSTIFYAGGGNIGKFASMVVSNHTTLYYGADDTARFWVIPCE